MDPEKQDHPSRQGKGDEPDPVPQPATPIDYRHDYRDDPANVPAPTNYEKEYDKPYGNPKAEYVIPVRDGWFEKYHVRRADGQDVPGSRHYRCKYLVLDLDHDLNGREVALQYADKVQATRPQYAADLRAYIQSLEGGDRA